MAQHLAAVLAASLAAQGKAAPSNVAAALDGVAPTAQHEAVAGDARRRANCASSCSARSRSVTLRIRRLRALASALADVTGAPLGYLPEGGNAVGAPLAGVLPHRGAGGRAVAQPGLNAVEMLARAAQGYVLVGGIEPADLVPSLGHRRLAARSPTASWRSRRMPSDEILATRDVHPAESRLSPKPRAPG